MSEDATESDRCPICKDKECKKHLLAIFDAQGDQGEFGVGLCGGPLYYVNEIGKVLQLARLAWVQSVRATGKPKLPRWIMKEKGIRAYFNAFGRSASGRYVSLDFEESESDEEAADSFTEASDMEFEAAREEFLNSTLFACGWQGDRTEKLYDSFPGMSATIITWWADKPREVIKKFRARLRSLLSEASNPAKVQR